MFQTFTTNSGLLFSFETKNRDLIFSTSDLKVMHQIFDGDSELYVGRIMNFDGIKYEIVSLSTFSNIQLTPDYPEGMTGIKYKYSHVLRLTVEKR